MDDTALLMDCYNQFAYASYDDYQDWENHVLTNGGLSTLEALEHRLGFESPIKRGDFWKLNQEEVKVKDG